MAHSLLLSQHEIHKSGNCLQRSINIEWICIHNRDNSKKLPVGLEILVDFPDAEETADQMEKNLNNWLIQIENNFKTPIDFLMDQNPDLSEEEAKLLYEKNEAFNKGNKEEILGPDGKPLPPQKPGLS